MKFFIALFALAAVALAEPEADPALFYSNLGYSYSGAYATPFAYNRFAYAGYSPYAYNRFAYGAYASPYHFGYSRLFKRDAEADPAVLYSSNFGYNYATPLAYNAHHFAPYNYYNNFAYGAFPYAHHHAYAHAYATPATHVTQVNNGGVSSTAAIHSGNRVLGGYANAGNYVANSAGVVHVAKREAEADPAVFYSGLGYHYAAPTAYAHSTYAYAPYSLGYRSFAPYYGNFGYRTYGHRYFF